LKSTTSYAWLSAAFLSIASFAGPQLHGQTTLNPEALSGRWETTDPQGGAVGMQLLLDTHVEGRSASLSDVKQTLDVMTVGLYRRIGPDPQPLGFNSFSVEPGGPARWDGRRLTIDFAAEAELPRINVDLVWDEKAATWTGHFERGAFHDNVVLRRPTAATTSSFEGTWSDSADLMNNCLHIASQSDGSLTGWGDDITIPGRMRYANGIQPPANTREHYGEIARVTTGPARQITVDMRAFTSGCCSHPFVAHLSGDGLALQGAWLAGANQVQRSVQWSKRNGNSCTAEPAKP
jgi:hypothetical protein